MKRFSLFLLLLPLVFACQNENKKPPSHSKKNSEVPKQKEYCADDSRFYLQQEKQNIAFYPVFFKNSWNRIKYFIDKQKLPPPQIIDWQNLLFSFYPDLSQGNKLIICPWNTSHHLMWIVSEISETADSIKFFPGSEYAAWRIIGGNCSFFSAEASELPAGKYALLIELVPRGEPVPGKTFFPEKSKASLPMSLNFYYPKKTFEQKLTPRVSSPDARDFGIAFLGGLTLRYRRILHQEQLTEKLLFQLLESSNLPRKQGIRKYLHLLTLLENENFGM